MMDESTYVRDRFDDLFSGDSDESSSSPYAQHSHDNFNSEDAAWQMRDAAVADDRRRSETLLDEQHMHDGGTSEVYELQLADLSVLVPSDDTYGDLEDPVLWDSSDNASISRHEQVDDGQPGPLTGRDDPKSIRASSPTESELLAKGVEFHNQMSESVRSRFFNEEHLRQACEDIDPALPRKIQWRAWRAAQDRHRFLRNYTESRNEIFNEASCSQVNCSASEHDRSIGTTQPIRHEGGLSRAQPVISDIPGLDYHAHASIVRSKPYLSNLKPAETRSHHPTTIPRSPQRQPSRTSSLSSLTTASVFSKDLEHNILIRGNNLDREMGSDTNPESRMDAPSPVRLNRPDYRALEKPSLITCESPLIYQPFSSYQPCTPVRSPSTFVTGMESTRAFRGSPTRSTQDVTSRPDTPRPSFSDSSMRESVEQGLPVNSWTIYRSPDPVPRSTSPSPSSLEDFEHTEQTTHSPMPLRQEPDTKVRVNPLTLCVGSQSGECLPDLPCASESHEIGSSTHLPSTAKSEHFVSDPQRVERLAAWLNFDEILRKAKEGISAKSKASPSSNQHLKSEESVLSSSDLESAVIDMPSLRLQDQAQALPSTDDPSSPNLVKTNAIHSLDSLDQKRTMLGPQLMKAWEESPRPTSGLIDNNRSCSGLILPDADPSRSPDDSSAESASDGESELHATRSDTSRAYRKERLSSDASPGIAVAIDQAKRNPCNPMGVRKTTRGLAQTLKKSRATSTKERPSARRAVTGKTRTATGVQGDNAKIQKPRTPARATSRKATAAGRNRQTNDDMPAVPPLPEPEQMDIDEILDQGFVLLELSQEAVQYPKPIAPSLQPSLKVDKTRKSSPIKPKPEPVEMPAEPKTPTRQRMKTAQGALTPQSAGQQITPRRRSPRLVEREQKVKAMAEAARLNETLTSEMELGLVMPTKQRVEPGQDAASTTRQNPQGTSIPKCQQAVVAMSKTSKSKR